MKKWIILSALLAGASTFAQEQEMPELADLLSPADLYREMADGYSLDLPGYDGFQAERAEMTPNVRLVIVVDKSEQMLYVYEDGAMTMSWAVSTAAPYKKCPPGRGCYYPSTPNGLFKPHRMHRRYTSATWNARMDYAMFITGGIALHATYGENVAKLGAPHSAGCVRQSEENARRIFDMVMDYGTSNTRVRVQN